MLLNFQGSDAYRMHQAISQLIKEQDPNGLSVLHVDMAQNGQAEELERELKYPSFFQNTRVIVVRNILANAQTAEQAHDILNRYDTTTDPSIVLVTVNSNENRPSAAAKKLITFLEKHGQSRSFDALAGVQLVHWINDFCSQRNTSIDPTAITTLTGRVTADSWALAQELEKLCAYANNQEITSEMVKELVPLLDERNEFELTDALYAHDKRGMVSALWRRLSDGTAEQLILGTLASGIRTMLIAKSMLSRGLNATAIAKAAGLHPFVTQKAIRGVGAYTEQQLRLAHERLAGLDRSSKDGRADIADELMAIILGI